jgi:hypothetical protein
MTNEPVKTQRFHKMLHLLRRLNCIHPALIPEEVSQAMMRYKKAVQPGDVKPKPGVIDELGRAKCWAEKDLVSRCMACRGRGRSINQWQVLVAVLWTVAPSRERCLGIEVYSSAGQI